MSARLEGVDVVTAADFRHYALSLPSTRDVPHFTRVAFKAHRIFATLAADGLTANLMLTSDEQHHKCQQAPDVFQPLPNAWGRRGATVMVLGQTQPAEMQSAIDLAYAHAVQRRRT